MPQFDFYSFSAQVFWSLSGFFVFYFFILRFYVRRIAEVFKFRKKLSNAFATSESSVAVNSTYDVILSTHIPR